MCEKIDSSLWEKIRSKTDGGPQSQNSVGDHWFKRINPFVQPISFDRLSDDLYVITRFLTHQIITFFSDNDILSGKSSPVSYPIITAAAIVYRKRFVKRTRSMSMSLYRRYVFVKFYNKAWSCNESERKT